MPGLLTIGEFSRATHLSVKALRHYDDVGLLHPADVDVSSGYRRYATAQVPIALVIRRFRELGMPLDEVRSVLDATDIETRDRTIVMHLERMEQALEQTQSTIASLKALLEGRNDSFPVEYRTVRPALAVAIRGEARWGEIAGWFRGALDELHQVLASVPHARVDVDMALFSPAFYEAHVGEIVVCVPVNEHVAVAGRSELIEIPAAHLAVTVHHGPLTDIDHAYGALGTFVAEHILGADGPIRERYLITAADTDEPSELQTEVGWPIRHVPR